MVCLRGVPGQAGAGTALLLIAAVQSAGELEDVQT